MKAAVAAATTGAGMPQWLIHGAGIFHISANTIVYTVGVLELLVGISLGSSMFVELFSILGLIILMCTPLFYGFNEALIHDLDLWGGLLALVFWPNRRFGNY